MFLIRNRIIVLFLTCIHFSGYAMGDPKDLPLGKWLDEHLERVYADEFFLKEGAESYRNLPYRLHILTSSKIVDKSKSKPKICIQSNDYLGLFVQSAQPIHQALENTFNSIATRELDVTDLENTVLAWHRKKQIDVKKKEVAYDWENTSFDLCSKTRLTQIAIPSIPVRKKSIDDLGITSFQLKSIIDLEANTEYKEALIGFIRVLFAPLGNKETRTFFIWPDAWIESLLDVIKKEPQSIVCSSDDEIIDPFLIKEKSELN
jgi:hypothetical protein